MQFPSSVAAKFALPYPSKLTLPAAFGDDIVRTYQTALGSVYFFIFDGSGANVNNFMVDYTNLHVSGVSGTDNGYNALNVQIDPSFLAANVAGTWRVVLGANGYSEQTEVQFQWGDFINDTGDIKTALGNPSPYTIVDKIQNSTNAGNLAATKAQNCLDVLGEPAMGHTVAGDLASILTATADLAATLATMGATLDDINAILSATKGMRAAYNSTTGLLTISQATSSVWQIRAAGSPTRVRIKVGPPGSQIQFDSDDYGGDFSAMIAAIGAEAGVQSAVGVSGGFDVTALPGVNVLAVTDLIVTGGTGTLTQTATGAIVPMAWVQYYSDAACTTPQNGPMGSALGKVRLSVAP